MRWKTPIIVAASLLLIAVLLPSFKAAVWDGRFPLTIEFNQSEALNAEVDTFLFAACWQEREAESAMRSGSESEIEFHSADEIDGNRVTVYVPCSGRSGPFGIEYSYVQPKYMVVQYSVSDEDTSLRRKRFEVPAERGNWYSSASTSEIISHFLVVMKRNDWEERYAGLFQLHQVVCENAPSVVAATEQSVLDSMLVLLADIASQAPDDHARDVASRCILAVTEEDSEITTL